MLDSLISSESPNAECHEISSAPGALLISSILSDQECVQILENISYEDYIDTNLDRPENEHDILRISHRSSRDEPEFALLLFARLRPFLPEVISIPVEDENYGPFSQGTWLLRETHERISCLKYEAGGMFCLNRDVIYMKNEHYRSLFTVLIYLNDDYEGGSTQLHSDEREIIYEIVPKVGMAFVMPKKMLYEECRVINGTKQAIKIDIMYEREGELDLSGYDNRQLAKKYFKVGANFERTGYAKEAIEYYKKAFKLDPSLDD